MLYRGLKQFSAGSAIFAALMAAATYAKAEEVYLSGSDRLMMFKSIEDGALTVTISAGALIGPVRVIEGGKHIFVVGEVAASKESLLDDYFASTRTVETEQGVAIDIGPPEFQCEHRAVNGAIRVRGTCLEALQVSVPVGSQARVIVNGKIERWIGPMSVEELMPRLEAATFGKDKLAVLSVFARANAARGRYLRSPEAMTILRAFTFDSEKVEAARILSGTLVQRGMAPAIAEVAAFDSEKREIVEALSR